jgi:hypothetical protein
MDQHSPIVTSLVDTPTVAAFTNKVMLNSGDGWKETMITITSAEERRLGDRVLQVPFYHKDMTVFLREEYGKKEYQGHFALEYSRLEVGGER